MIQVRSKAHHALWLAPDHPAQGVKDVEAHLVLGSGSHTRVAFPTAQRKVMLDREMPGNRSADGSLIDGLASGHVR